jgi:SHS2 domain-containing protein
MKRYEELDHTADWSFRAFGRDLCELYENAAYALSALQGVLDIQPTLSRSIHVEAIDREALMVNWLAEILYLQETKHEAYQEFQVTRLTDTTLDAELDGAPAPLETKFVKAVTYHELKIEQTASGWQAQLVVDV